MVWKWQILKKNTVFSHYLIIKKFQRNLMKNTCIFREKHDFQRVLHILWWIFGKIVWKLEAILLSIPPKKSETTERIEKIRFKFRLAPHYKAIKNNRKICLLPQFSARRCQNQCTFFIPSNTSDDAKMHTSLSRQRRDGNNFTKFKPLKRRNPKLAPKNWW